MWIKEYFGGNSKGVRNWLSIAAVGFAGIFALGVYSASLLPLLLSSLLIAATVIAAIGLAAALVTTIFSVYDDYQEYKKGTSSEKQSNYLFYLLFQAIPKFAAYHPITLLFLIPISLGVVAMSVIFLTYGAVATPLLVFVSSTLGGISLPLAGILSSLAMGLVGIMIGDIISRLMLPIMLNDATGRSKVNADLGNYFNQTQANYRYSRVDNTPSHPFSPPKPSLNIAVKSGEFIRLDNKILVTRIKESESSGEYTNTYGSTSTIDFTHAIFECLNSAYLLIAYRKLPESEKALNETYMFLNVSKEQSKDPEICKRFFERCSGLDKYWQFDFLLISFDQDVDETHLEIPDKNVASWQQLSSITNQHVQSVSIDLATQQVKRTFSQSSGKEEDVESWKPSLKVESAGAQKSFS